MREQDVAVTLKNLVYDNPGLRTVYQFGQLALALLNRRAAQIHLAVQFDQVELVERPSELVNKEELIARVWPKIFVDPANLAVHISALRRALRDGRDGNRFLINVPGRLSLRCSD